MMRSTVFVCLTVFFFAAESIPVAHAEQGFAKQQDDTTTVPKEIEKTVEDYVIGWREADVPRLAEAFAGEGRILWMSGDDNSRTLASRTFSEVLKRRKENPKYGLEWSIKNFDVVDDQLAFVKVYISTRNGYYLDCLLLKKIEGKWKIITKTFVYFPNEEK